MATKDAGILRQRTVENMNDINKSSRQDIRFTGCISVYSNVFYVDANL